MLRRPFALGLLVVVLLGPAHAGPPRPTLLIDLGVLDDGRLREVLTLFGPGRGNALASHIRGRALLVATDAEATVLRERGFEVTELMRDSAEVRLFRRALYGPTLTMPAAYHSYGEVLAVIDSLIAARPDLIRRREIGRTSQEGRPIVAVTITSRVRPEDDKPPVLLNGCHHADEVLGAEICLTAMRDLVGGYGSDSSVTAWVDALEIVIVPVVNVDGHEVVTSGRDPRWRKNTRDTNRNGVLWEYPEGVDLNRNYDFNWAHGGSPDSTSVRFRGWLPMTEQENVAMDGLARDRRFLLSLTYHSQGEVIYYPWSWRGRPAPDDRLLTEIARDLAGSITTMAGDTCYRAEYGAGTVGQTYPYLYGRYGTMDFVVETGRGSHIFPEEEVPGIVAANLEGIRTIMRRAAGPGLALRVIDRTTRKPLGATVWLPDIDTEDVDRRVAHPVTGRHWRLLQPGTHRLVISTPGYQRVLRHVEIRPDGWTEVSAELTRLTERESR